MIDRNTNPSGSPSGTDFLLGAPCSLQLCTLISMPCHTAICQQGDGKRWAESCCSSLWARVAHTTGVLLSRRVCKNGWEQESSRGPLIMILCTWH
jgi:hypothetical protein